MKKRSLKTLNSRGKSKLHPVLCSIPPRRLLLFVIPPWGTMTWGGPSISDLLLALSGAALREVINLVTDYCVCRLKRAITLPSISYSLTPRFVFFYRTLERGVEKTMVSRPTVSFHNAAVATEELTLQSVSAPCWPSLVVAKQRITKQYISWWACLY